MLLCTHSGFEDHILRSLSLHDIINFSDHARDLYSLIEKGGTGIEMFRTPPFLLRNYNTECFSVHK